MTKTYRTETVSNGTTHLGTITVSERGSEAFGPLDQYLATYPTLNAARRALFELHRDSQAAQGGAA